jgi:hypothetical protein
MTKVAILPIPTAQGDLSYHAIAGAKHAEGKTAGEALDALTAQLSADEANTLVIVQSLHPDRQGNGGTLGDEQHGTGCGTATVDAPWPFLMGTTGLTLPLEPTPNSLHCYVASASERGLPRALSASARMPYAW